MSIVILRALKNLKMGLGGEGEGCREVMKQTTNSTKLPLHLMLRNPILRQPAVQLSFFWSSYISCHILSSLLCLRYSCDNPLILYSSPLWYNKARYIHVTCTGSWLFFIRQAVAVEAVLVLLCNIIHICWTALMRGKWTFKCSQQPMVLLDLTFEVEVNMA